MKSHFQLLWEAEQEGRKRTRKDRGALLSGPAELLGTEWDLANRRYDDGDMR